MSRLLTENRLQILSIFGREIPIRTQELPERVEAIAQSVDSRMREVAESVKIKDPLRIAILTSLNFAGDAQSGRQFSEEQKERVRDMIQRIDLDLKNADSVLHTGTEKGL